MHSLRIQWEREKDELFGYHEKIVMPTLLNINGFKFFFYANEHEPKHIHVIYAGDFAKIELDELRVVNNFMKPKELKKALILIGEHKEEFEKAWDEYFS